MVVWVDEYSVHFVEDALISFKCHEDERSTVFKFMVTDFFALKKKYIHPYLPTLICLDRKPETFFLSGLSIRVFYVFYISQIWQKLVVSISLKRVIFLLTIKNFL